MPYCGDAADHAPLPVVPDKAQEQVYHMSVEIASAFNVALKMPHDCAKDVVGFCLQQVRLVNCWFTFRTLRVEFTHSSGETISTTHACPSPCVESDASEVQMLTVTLDSPEPLAPQVDVTMRLRAVTKASSCRWRNAIARD